MPVEALERLAEQAGLANPGGTANDQAATGSPYAKSVSL